MKDAAACIDAINLRQKPCSQTITSCTTACMIHHNDIVDDDGVAKENDQNDPITV